MDLDHDSYIDAGLSTDRCDLPTARRQTNRKGFPVEPTYFDDIGDGYSYIDDGHNVVTGLQAAKITPSIVRTSNVRPLSDDLLRRLARASIEEKKVHTKEGLPMTALDIARSITPHPLSPAPSIRPAIPPRQPPSLNTEDVLSNIYGEYAVLGGAPFRSYRSPTVESIASSRTPSHVSPYNLRNVSVTGAGSRKSAKSQIAPSETSARPSDHRQGTGFDGQYSESDKDQEQELSDHMMQLVDLAHQNGLSPDGLAALASEAGIHLDPLAYIALQQTPKPTETASISTHPSAHRSHPSAKPREQGRTLVPPSERQSIISPFSPLVNPTTRHAQAARSYDFATGDMAWLQSEYTPPPLAHPRPQRQKAFTAGIEGDSCAFEIERSSHLPSRVSSGGKLPPVSVSQWGRVGDGHCNAVWGGRAVSVSGGGSVRRSESRRD
ncbi:hypothetical protein M8818_003754 [Zalaria obscura]|uniref:Uncharacterized protein n=1 Tax=Zalaria obscura TaxID=2024903 RepID=A0ACC3SE88_9PEZI